MTVLLALVGAVGARDDAEVERLAEAGLMMVEGSTALHRPAPDVVLAVASPAWDGAANQCLAHDERFTVVAHASLFYRRDLARALEAMRVAPPDSGSAASWILAALRCWGDEALHRLEGEFAFVAWDARERRLLAARDHGGARPLFHAAIGEGIAVASSLRVARSVPGCAGAWNVLALAEDAGDLDLAHSEETAFSAIGRVPAGSRLVWQRGQTADVRRWWEIPIFERDSGVPFEEGAEELLRLLADAVAERADLDRGSAVMLSGGYDSSAVFGAGSWRLTRGTEGPTPLRSVSFSHPPDDPGREDELIEAIAARWGVAPHFIACGEVPAIEPSLERARLRDEPLGHTYELWNRALALGCREQGARIGMNGNGGDPWFSTSPVFLADLLRQGRLREFRREWRLVVGAMTWYRLFKVALQPNLPHWASAALGWMRGGRPFSDAHERPIPGWMAEPMRRDPVLRARRLVRTRRRPGETLSAAGRVWFLEASFAERINALVFAICQQEGVELRTPLLDARLIRFAATRPRWESNSGRENKRLLRRALQGLLPAEVLAPRQARTGLPSTYLRRTLRAHFEEARSELAGGMLLAELGVVDHRVLSHELGSYLAGQWSDDERAVAMLSALRAEWWLRSLQ